VHTGGRGAKAREKKKQEIWTEKEREPDQLNTNVLMYVYMIICVYANPHISEQLISILAYSLFHKDINISTYIQL